MVGAAGLVAIGVLTARFSHLHQAGEQGARVWFYDQGTKHLYEAPRDTIAPDRAGGSHGRQGVRAVVVCFRGEQRDSRKRRIAYLEKYTLELKDLLERVRAARAAGQAAVEHIPARNSAYFQTNTLVKRPEEASWSPASSPEGQRIMAEWRAWRGPDGQSPIVCVP